MPRPRNEKVNEEEIKRKKDARNEVLSKSDAMLMLLLGFENEDCSVATFIKDFNIKCCILIEANNCTEPESIIPLTYGITKYILIGNKLSLCDISYFTNIYDDNRSLFNRASI